MKLSNKTIHQAGLDCGKAGHSIDLLIDQLRCSEKKSSPVPFPLIWVVVGAVTIQISESQTVVVEQKHFSICSAKHAADGSGNSSKEGGHPAQLGSILKLLGQDVIANVGQYFDCIAAETSLMLRNLWHGDGAGARNQTKIKR